MTRLSRRSVLRSGAGLALLTATAGCTDRIGGTAEANDDIPGVEDGEIADHHVFASAHHDRLASRTGRLEWTRVTLDRETGESRSHTVWTVRVDGERVHAVVSGRGPMAGKSKAGGPGRREFYFGDGTTMYYRTQTDDGWDTMSAEPNEMAVSESDFTGRSRLETPPLRRVGTETVDGQKLHRFGHSTRVPDDEQVLWTSIQALVDADALVHSYIQTLDRKARSHSRRRVDEWYVTDLDATTVNRPDWVSEVDT